VRSEVRGARMKAAKRSGTDTTGQMDELGRIAVVVDTLAALFGRQTLCDIIYYSLA
jgi:hypothetical protein